MCNLLYKNDNIFVITLHNKISIHRKKFGQVLGKFGQVLDKICIEGTPLTVIRSRSKG